MHALKFFPFYCRQGAIDITCDALEDNMIDWDCIFGPDSLEEVHERGGEMTSCSWLGSVHPCARSVAIYPAACLLDTPYYDRKNVKKQRQLRSFFLVTPQFDAMAVL